MCEACDEREETEDADERGGRRRLGRNYAGPFRPTPGRLAGMGLIRLYQLTLSGFIGNSCRHLPTCSEFGYEAVARHGLWTGGWLTLFRVGRCGPFGSSGFDPVPESLDPRYRWWRPWGAARRRPPSSLRAEEIRQP